LNPTKEYGEVIRNARKHRKMTPIEFAESLHVSRSLTEKWETGERSVVDSYRKDIAEVLDTPELYFQSWKESTGFVSLPYLDGVNIDHHPSAMRFMALREVKQALNDMDNVCWTKPVEAKSEQERQEVRKVIFEILDAATTLINLVAILVRRYDFSMKKIFKEWRLTVKARGWKN